MAIRTCIPISLAIFFSSILPPAFIVIGAEIEICCAEFPLVGAAIFGISKDGILPILLLFDSRLLTTFPTAPELEFFVSEFPVTKFHAFPAKLPTAETIGFSGVVNLLIQLKAACAHPTMPLKRFLKNSPTGVQFLINRYAAPAIPATIQVIGLVNSHAHSSN